MAKQTIFGRIAQLTKANINALIDAAEDPEKMLDQMVRDYTNNIREAEAAVAQTIGNLRLLEKDHAEDVKAAQEWGTKALAASNKADEFRAAGDVANADKFDTELDDYAGYAYWGRRKNNGVIMINKTVLEQELEKNGFDFSALKKKWAESGHLLKTTQGRFSNVYRLHNTRANYVALYVKA